MPLKGRSQQIQTLLGQTIGGKYRIVRLVGAGGMGAVYEAINLSIHKRVALKFLFRDDALSRDSLARFQREAEAASAFNSAHIVQIFDAGSTDDERPYLVMELLDGEDLRQHMKHAGRLALPVALRITEQLLRGLGRAHEAGVIHRDLKPDNVFLCRRDDDPLFVKILDFGISKLRSQAGDTLTREGTVLGTAHYMSPEQAQSYEDIDGRADLYSVGAILYEALAGRPPHQGQTYEAVLIRACTTPAEDVRSHAPEVPAPIAEVLARSIRLQRSERYQTAEEFAAALAEAAPEAWIEPPRSLTTPREPATSPALADTLEDAKPPLAGSQDSPDSSRVTQATRVEPAVHPGETLRRRRAKAAGLLFLGVVSCTALAMALVAQHPRIARAPMASASATEKPSPPRALVQPAPNSSKPSPSALGPTPRVPPSALDAQRTAGVPARTRPRAPSAAAPKPAASTPPVSEAPGVAGQLELKTEGP